METASTYYTRRARQERASAVDAVSAQARTAHLEMAFRLVTIATKPALWGPQTGHNDNALDDMGETLRDVFPATPTDEFQHLLDAVDQTSDRD
jgi:hypothetical protein